jgi:hypothetical protein
MKLDCERTTFISGFCVFLVHRNRFRVSQPPRSLPTYRPQTVTRKGSVAAPEPAHSTECGSTAYGAQDVYYCQDVLDSKFSEHLRRTLGIPPPVASQPDLPLKDVS